MGILNKIKDAGKGTCVGCKKEFRYVPMTKGIGHDDEDFATIGDGIENGFYDEADPLPKEYDYDDSICGECIREWKAASKEINKEYEKKLFFGKAALMYKSEYTAILHQTPQNLLQFVVAFDDLTEEGYRCVAQDEGMQVGVSLGIEISGGANSYYYFQKIECVSCNVHGDR